jgi:arylsulfatase A-like enzyme
MHACISPRTFLSSCSGTASVLALLLFAWAGGWGPPTPAAERPNIVFILADDLGYGDVGCYNPESKIPTPHLDRLAREGIRLTDAHSPASVCTPTRYALLTGRYAWRSRLKRGVLGPWSPPLIEEGRLTVASLLRQHGYATACIGKWHLGWQWPTKDGQPPATGANRLSNVDFTQPIAAGPTTRGFDDYFGTDVPNYPPFCHIENDRTVGIPSVVNWPHMNVPGPMLPGWNWINVLPEHAARAVRYIDEHRQAHSDQPFFLYLPLTSPHYPVVPDPAFRCASQAGKFGDFVAQTDDVVGQILDALARAGAAENTLVFFTSDNGPWLVMGSQGGSAGPLRDGKGSTWEGGMRVPGIAWMPGRVAPGVTQAPASILDLFPTLLSLAGRPLPSGVAIDGADISPLLFEQKEPPQRPFLYYRGDQLFACRLGEWKLHLKTQPGYGQAQAEAHDPPLLFHLGRDPGERRNLASEHPAELARLVEAIRRHQALLTPAPSQLD